MPQIILKERTVHLGSQTFFTKDVDQYKNTSLSQLYQPPRTVFHRTLITGYFRPVNIAKFLRTTFLQNTSRSSRLQIILKIGILKSFANVTGKDLCWRLFLKNLQAEGLQLHKKILQHRCFPVKLRKFLSTPVLTEHLQWLLLQLRWLLLYFFKKVLFNSYFATWL